VGFVVAACALIAVRRGAEVNFNAPSKSAALAEALRARGIVCEADDVTWVVGPRGVKGAMLGGARALVRAKKGDDLADLYFVDARLSPEGALLDIGGDHDLTLTGGVDESRPLVRAGNAAYTTSSDGTVTGVHTIDLSGRGPEAYADFTRIQRWQTELTNLQKTGQSRGIVHNAFALDPVANDAQLSWASDAYLTVRADGRTITLDVPNARAVEGAGWVRPALDQKGRPGNLVTWSVDRVREMPWFGEEKMQYVKAVAFTGLDWIVRSRAKIFGETNAAKAVAEDLGTNVGQTQTSFTDPEIGWPPPPMPPIFATAIPNEGQWIALDKDPFITHVEGAPPAFVTTFIRPEKQRPATRIYVTMWDPRQIALHMEAGTVEPVSATGEAGPGVIPRTPEVLRRVVAGFNGGFQALHGEYGMQANGILYLPPKPYAATILEMRDGSTAFGTWPHSSEVPDEVLSYRQNLTALVQGDKFNPFGRTWWGGTPKGWADNIHTTRSGVCLTKENFVGYFFGVEISAEVLAQAMLIGRCAYGVHLDMNPGLAGFEFYNVAPASSWTPLGRPIQSDWEVEGTFRELPDFKFRARRMIRGMQEQNFPQYIHRDNRDFFYLTQRPVLPGADLPAPVTPKQPGEGVWRTKGLPQHGFPYAMATAWTRPDPEHPASKVRAVRVDPRTVRHAGSSGTTADTPTVISFVGSGKAPKTGELGLWLANGVFLIGGSAPDDNPGAALAIGVPVSAPPAMTSRVAVGVHDEDGMLEWIELFPEVHADAKTALLLDKQLERSGCSMRMLVPGDARALLGGSLDPSGDPAPPAGTAPTARLVRGSPPGAHLAFDSTPVVPPAVWQPLQMQRVRYFRKPSKEKSPDAGAPKGDSPGGDARGTPGPAPTQSGASNSPDRPK
jgi:hypothetical protein